jgi:integrase/recombinase XerD
LQALKEFLAWLHVRPGYRRRSRAARATSPKSYATLEQYRAALLAMPSDNEVERRDQALMALLLLTAMRDAAIVGLKLKHISIERGCVFQDPREIKTKFRKSIETTFLPVGEDIAAIIRDWVRYLTNEKLYGPNDPLFPKTAVRPDEHHSFTVHGLTSIGPTHAVSVRFSELHLLG